MPDNTSQFQLVLLCCSIRIKKDILWKLSIRRNLISVAPQKHFNNLFIADLRTWHLVDMNLVGMVCSMFMFQPLICRFSEY